MAYQAEIEKLEARFREKPEQWFAALADAYRKAGDLDMALEVLGAWIDKRPNYTSGHIVLGRCYLDKEQDGQAADAFENVLKLDMENVIALKCLSEIAGRQGDTGAARDWLERLLEVDPMNEEAQEALEKLGAEGAEGAGGAEEIEAAEVVEGESSDVMGFEPTAAQIDEEVAEEAEEAEAVEAGAWQGGSAPEMVEEAEEAEWQGGSAAEEAEAAERQSGSAAEMAEAAEGQSGSAAEMADVIQAMEEEVAPVGLEDEGDVEAPEAEGAGGAEWAEPEEPAETPVDEEVEKVEEAAEAIETTLPEPMEPIRLPGPAPAPAFEMDQSTADVEEVEEEEVEVEVEEERRIEATVAEFPPIEIEEEPAAAAPSAPLAPSAPAGATPVAPRATLGIPEMYVYGEHEDDSGLPSVGKAEEQEGVMEPSVEFVEPPPEDLDATVAEQPVEKEPEPETPLELIVPAGVSDESGAPLTISDEPTQEAEALPADLEPAGATVADSGTPEPEPIVTETMAELYAKQGLVEKAKDIYRLLLVSKPGDPHLRARLAELEEADAGAAPEAATNKFLAAATGGESVRAVMEELVGAAVTTEATEAAEETAATGTTETTETTPIEKTKEVPAIDVETSPAPSAPAEGGRSFSFDDFFGGGGEQPEAEEAPPSASGQGPDNEEFKDWLKGLKT